MFFFAVCVCSLIRIACRTHALAVGCATLSADLPTILAEFGAWGAASEFHLEVRCGGFPTRRSLNG